MYGLIFRRFWWILGAAFFGCNLLLAETSGYKLSGRQDWNRQSSAPKASKLTF